MTHTRNRLCDGKPGSLSVPRGPLTHSRGRFCDGRPRNASQRLATPRNALARCISRTRYALRPERDSTAGERNEANAMHRRHHARQAYDIATTCTFQSTAAPVADGTPRPGRECHASSSSFEFALASACAFGLRFTCATTYSHRVFAGIRMSIQTCVCAHT